MSAPEAELRALDAKLFLPRTFGYLRHIGPGYIQSAMPLGGGTAFASIFAGAAFGYQLLWVAPLVMLLGILVLSAVVHQTLSTGADPFRAMKQRAGPLYAYVSAFGAIASAIIWQFAQYALASAMLVAVAKSARYQGSNGAMGFGALVCCVLAAILYDSRPSLVRLYENLIKGMVWFLIACFGLVVIQTGTPHPGELLSGLVPFHIPGENQGVRGITLVVSGLAVAVGANMVFVYPYTPGKRGRGRQHRRLAHIDLGFGMFLPYAIAASLMLIASASVFYCDRMRCRVETAAGPIELDDGLLEPHVRRLATLPAASPARLVFAAAHIVMLPSYASMPHTLARPVAPAEITPRIDWETTTELRRRLDQLGFGIDEAMNTAQCFSIGWENVLRLIQDTGAARLDSPFVAGAGVDHLEAIGSEDKLVEGVVYQARAIQAAGGSVILLPLVWLCEQGYERTTTCASTRASSPRCPARCSCTGWARCSCPRFSGTSRARASGARWRTTRARCAARNSRRSTPSAKSAYAATSWRATRSS